MEETTKAKMESRSNLKVQVEKISGLTQGIHEKSAPVIEEGKAQAKAYAAEAQRKTKSALSDRKERAVGELSNLSQAFRETGS